ncbi:MAG TPA: MltA domain-containing protein [Trichocoleus sp.]
MTRRLRRCIPVLIIGGFFLASLGATPASRTAPASAPIAVPQEILVPTANPPMVNLGYDDRLWSTASDRANLIQAIDYSLQYLSTPQAETAYAQYAVPGFTRDRIQRSLRRLKYLVRVSKTPEAFQQAMLREFTLYQSVGRDGQGTVDFTGYFEPIYAASRTPTAEYRYPLYRRPPNLDAWAKPHPTRLELEGADGLQANQGRLAGLELVWLKDRLEAFLVQVQGSAKLKLPDGTLMSVGYAGRTEYPYRSIGRALVEDGILPAEGLTLPQVIAYFRQHPEALDTYLPQNQRFIFFKETDGGSPSGSLRVPVTAGRSIATDKTLMPPGALALIAVSLPERRADGTWSSRPINRFVLDQDTGGAITGPGRVDLFVGTGPEAGEQAGLINTTGSLYYLLLRE